MRWLRTNVPVEAVFAVDRWPPYPPQIFMAQQAVLFPTRDASFLNEDALFRSYFRFFDERIRRYQVEPFFNSVETPDERAEFVEALGVTHILVSPVHYDELRPVLKPCLGSLLRVRPREVAVVQSRADRAMTWLATGSAPFDAPGLVTYDERDSVKVSSSETLALRGGSPVRSSFLPFHQPLVDADDEHAVLETLRSGWLTTGPRTKAFEKDLAAYTRAAHCIAVNSCTAALHLALEAVGVGAGDEVITSPITFASTANVIVHRGARPVFVDVEPDTFNIDAAAVERALTPRTKALLPVDFAGQPCDLDAIMAIGARHRIPVIEDAAHAIGAGTKDDELAAWPT